MCIQFFKGKGYDKNFVKSMQAIIDKLLKNPYVEIVMENDEICKNCPNAVENECKTNEKVLKIDKNVMRICKTENNTIMLANDFFKIVKENIIDKNKINIVCKGCQWIDICANGNDY